MIATYKKQATRTFFAFLAILVLIAIVIMVQGKNDLTTALMLASGVCFFWSCWALAKAKGRSGWWLLAPLIANWLGALIILLLKDRTASAASGTAASATDEPPLPEWARTK